MSWQLTRLVRVQLGLRVYSHLCDALINWVFLLVILNTFFLQFKCEGIGLFCRRLDGLNCDLKLLLVCPDRVRGVFIGPVLRQ